MIYMFVFSFFFVLNPLFCYLRVYVFCYNLYVNLLWNEAECHYFLKNIYWLSKFQLQERYKLKAQRMFLSAQSCIVTNGLFTWLAVKTTFKTTFKRVSPFLIFSYEKKNNSRDWIRIWILNHKTGIRPGLWITKRMETYIFF